MIGAPISLTDIIHLSQLQRGSQPGQPQLTSPLNTPSIHPSHLFHNHTRNTFTPSHIHNNTHPSPMNHEYLFVASSISTVALALDKGKKQKSNAPLISPRIQQDAAGRKKTKCCWPPFDALTVTMHLILLHNVALLRHVESVQELLKKYVSMFGLFVCGYIFFARVCTTDSPPEEGWWEEGS